MNARLVERALWSAALAILALAAIAWRRALPRAHGLPSDPFVAPAVLPVLPADSLAAAATTITEHDPFRAARRPAAVAYRPELEDAPPAPPAPSPPRPALLVRGIVGGPPWEALLDGVPGRAGVVVVRRGDVLGPAEQSFRVRSIGRDTVIIQGADTTWRLTIHRAW